MRMRVREIVSGRSALAWRRGFSRGALWLRALSAASAWLPAQDPLGAAEWNTSVFGARLAELTAANRVVATRPSAERFRQTGAAGPQRRIPRLRDRPDPLIGDPHRNEPASPVSRRARGRAHAGTSACGRPPLPVTPGAVAMAGERLATLAGTMPRTLRRSHPHSEMAARRASPNAGRSTDVGAPTAVDPSTSSAVLARRVVARLDRAFARAFGRPFSAGTGFARAANANGFAIASARPDSGFVPIPRGAPVVSTALFAPKHIARSVPPLTARSAAMFGAAPAGASGNVASIETTSWRSRIAAPEPGLVLAEHGGRSSSADLAPSAPPADTAGAPPRLTASQRRSAAPGRLPVRDASDARGTSSPSMPDDWVMAFPATPEDTPARREPEPLPAFPRTRPHQGSPARTTESISIAASREATRPRFDPVEFAEHLRAALVDDARRFGIDV